MINWSKYFDKIYCINFVQFKTRKQLMQFELKRVGILDSGIFNWQTTYNRKMDKEIEDFIRKKYQKELDSWNNISLILGHYNAIRDAYYSGCNNVLIIEDDTRFLKNLDEIQQILEHKPKGQNIILYDKQINIQEYQKQFISINDYFASFTNCLSAACYQLDRIGMEKIMSLIETEPHAVDGYFFDVKRFLNNVKCCCAKTNISVQAVFDSSNSLIEYHKNNIISFQSAYSLLNIDFNKYMIKQDGSYYNYGDILTQKEQYIKITQNQIVDIRKPITPITMNIFIAVDKSKIRIIPSIIYSLKKYSNSNFNIYLMSDFQDMKGFQNLVSHIATSRVTFNLISSNIIYNFLDKNYNINHLTILTYAKLLIPILFPNLERMLYLDYDVCCFRKGIEWFYNIDFEDNYLAVCGSDLIQRMKNNNMTKKEWLAANFFECRQHYIFSHLTNCYFNAGILMWNIKKMIEDGYDKKLVEIMSTFPTDENNQDLAKIDKDLEIFAPEDHIEFQLHDQSVLNYLFRNKIINCNPIFNSAETNLYTHDFLDSEYRIKELNKWDIKNEQFYLNKIIIAHFAGINKPWFNIPNDYLTSYYQYLIFLKYRELVSEARKHYYD